jgi:hypothetical protein
MQTATNRVFLVGQRFLSRGSLAAILPLFPRRLQFPIPVGLNLLLMPSEHVRRRDVADGTVQTDVVVMVYVTLNQTPHVFQRQQRSGTQALPGAKGRGFYV